MQVFVRLGPSNIQNANSSPAETISEIMIFSMYTPDFADVIITYGLWFFPRTIRCILKEYCAVWSGMNSGSIRAGWIRDSCHPISVEWGLNVLCQNFLSRNRSCRREIVIVYVRLGPSNITCICQNSNKLDFLSWIGVIFHA